MAAFDLIVRGGTLSDGKAADVAILDEHVVEIGSQLSGTASEVIDATGLLVLPGTVDVHVHLNQPGRTSWEGVRLGTRALAAGGTTTACDMPLNSSPPTVDPDGFDRKARVVRRSAHIDLALWGGIVPGSVKHMRELATRGVVGFKAFMSDSGVPDFPRVDDDALGEGMRVAARLGLPVAVHAEDQALIDRLSVAVAGRAMRDFARSRPARAELGAVRRAVALAAETGCSLHVVHVSTPGAARHVAEARSRGVDVSCEVTAHHLLLDERDAERLGVVAKCAPPLRPRRAVDGLWAALESGRIDFVASDHSPSPPHLRRADDAFASWGGIGAGQLLTALIHDAARHRGWRVGDRLGAAPADRLKLARKGRIAVGEHADLVLLDCAGDWAVSKRTLHHRHRQTPFEGRRLLVRPVRTLLRGHTVALDGRPVGPPRGRLLRPE